MRDADRGEESHCRNVNNWHVHYPGPVVERRLKGASVSHYSSPDTEIHPSHLQQLLPALQTATAPWSLPFSLTPRLKRFPRERSKCPPYRSSLKVNFTQGVGGGCVDVCVCVYAMSGAIFVCLAEWRINAGKLVASNRGDRTHIDIHSS